MKRRKILALFLAMAMLSVILTSCGNSNGNDPSSDDGGGEFDYTIGFCDYQTCEFTMLMRQGIQEVCDKYNADLKVLDARYDGATQLSQVENFISQGVDAIILAPCDKDALVPAVDYCKEANMPLVVVNCALNTDEEYYYVGPNDVQAGELEADYLLSLLDYAGNVCVLECRTGTSYQIDRAEGIKNITDQYADDVTVLDIQSCDGNREKALEQMENWINAYGDTIDGVISQNDDMALGAISALESANLGDVPVVGVDAIEDALNSIIDGKMKATVYQDAMYEGGQGAEVAFQLIRGETPEKVVDLIEMTLITQEDAQDLFDQLYGG